MPKFKNVSPLGDLELVLPARNITVTAGEVFTVSDEESDLLSGQPANWEAQKGSDK